jgi:hypothetical protein
MELLQAGQEFDLTVQAMQGPCVLVYHDDSNITDAFLLCEGRVACQANIHTAYQVVMMLMASYFVMDKKYPKPYQLFLWFIHEKVLHLPADPAFRKTVTFNRFKKEYDQS